MVSSNLATMSILCWATTCGLNHHLSNRLFVKRHFNQGITSKVKKIDLNKQQINSNFSVSSSRSSCKNKKQRLEPPWRILFLGTDDFSLASLMPLTAKFRTGTLMNALGVISPPDSPVRKFAESENLTVHEWPPDDATLKNYDIGMLVSFGKLIPENIINALPLGIVNVHGSLLPRWRGASPIAYAIMHGDSETGVTIFQIRPNKFDVGEIVRQYRCSISPNDTTPVLTKKLANYGSHLLMECLRDLPRCLDMSTPQPQEGVTYAPKLTAKLAAVDWNMLTAKEVYNRHRALSHVYALTTNWFNTPVKLHNIFLAPEDNLQVKQQVTAATNKSALDFLNDVKTGDDKTAEKLEGITPGKILFSYKQKVIKVQCRDGAWVTCDQFRVKNRIMSAVDFSNGFLSKQNQESWVFG